MFYLFLSIQQSDISQYIAVHNTTQPYYIVAANIPIFASLRSITPRSLAI